MGLACFDGAETYHGADDEKLKMILRSMGFHDMTDVLTSRKLLYWDEDRS